MPQSRSLAACLLVALLCSVAEAGTPRLTRITPPGGQRGTTVTVEFAGRYLEQPKEVILYEAGITVEAVEMVEPEPVDPSRDQGRGRGANRGPRGPQVKVRLNVAADCPLGSHGMRLVTAHGISDYQRFFVGPFPILEEEESQNPQTRNDKIEAAKQVGLNTTVQGRMIEPADIDLFRIEAKKGQRISAEIESARLGTERGLPDLHLAILDEHGKPVRAADDSALFVQDPILSMLADRDGTYFVAVRHSIYNANNEFYRLHVGTFSRPTAIFPSGGQVGQELEVTVLGDPQGDWKQTVKLPADKPGEFRFTALDDGIASPTPNILRVSPFPNVLEVEPNDSPEALSAAPVATLPVALNGIIEKPGDVDCYRFAAKKGDRFKIHALANAFGSPLDPTISILRWGDQRNRVEARATDSRPNQLGTPPAGGLNRDTLDPVIEFTVPADGEYVLKVEDDRGNGGADFVYRVEIQPETDAVYTYLPLEPENQFTPQTRQTINVPAGNRYNTSIAIFNANRAFNGELELVAVGLPDGVTMHAPRVSAGMPRVPVVFEAAAGTPVQARLIDIIARPVESNGTTPLVSGFRQVVAMNAYGNNDYYLHTLLDKVAISVTEPAPFTIEVEEPKSALVQNGEMLLKFKVIRSNGFDGPVTVSMEWRPNGVTGATPVLVKPDQTAGGYLISAQRNATASTNQVVLTCVSGGERPGYYDSANRNYVATKPFKLTIAEPHIEARFARTSIERGKTADMVVKLNHLRPFTGKAKVTLTRLPRGIKLVDEAPREITADDKEVKFTLQATEECLVGNFQGITMDLTVLEDGQSIRQLSGYGLLRIDAERGVAATK